MKSGFKDPTAPKGNTKKMKSTWNFDQPEYKTICESIHNFLCNKEMLEAKEDDDLDDDQIWHIYSEVYQGYNNEK